MGLMDRDYYREKKSGRGLKEWIRENPLSALVLGVLILGILVYLLS